MMEIEKKRLDGQQLFDTANSLITAGVILLIASIIGRYIGLDGADVVAGSGFMVVIAALIMWLVSWAIIEWRGDTDVDR